MSFNGTILMRTEKLVFEYSDNVWYAEYDNFI